MLTEIKKNNRRNKMNIKNAFKALETAERVSTRASEEWDRDPENESLEAAFDAAYAAEFKAFDAVVAEMVKVSHGMISAKLAGVMLRTKRAEVRDLIGRLA